MVHYSYSYGPNLSKPNPWKPKQNGGHFVQNVTPLANQTPFKNRTEGYHWKSECVRYSSPHLTVILFQFRFVEFWETFVSIVLRVENKFWNKKNLWRNFLVWHSTGKTGPRKIPARDFQSFCPDFC